MIEKKHKNWSYEKKREEFESFSFKQKLIFNITDKKKSKI